jgi:hypothetical protein
MEALHYTSQRNCKRILCYGLEPRTKFFNDFYERKLVASHPELLSLANRRFIVAIPSERIGSWVATGLMDRLKDYTTGEVIVSFDLKNTEGIFVREHNNMIRDWFTELLRMDGMGFKKNPFKVVYEAFSNERESIRRYLLSSRKLSEVSLDDYLIPELWIPHPISTDSLQLRQNRPD